MNRKQKILVAVFAAVAVIAAILVSAWLYAAEKLSHLEQYKASITQTLSEELNREVSYETGTASLTLRNGLSFRFTNMAVREKDGASDFLKVHSASVRVGILPLLINRIVLAEIVLTHPGISLIRDPNGDLNIADLLVEKEDGRTAKLRKVIIDDGVVTFLDQAAGAKDILISLEEFKGRIHNIFGTNRYRFYIETLIPERSRKARLQLEGVLRAAPAGKPFYESTVRTSVRVEGVDLEHYSAYLKHYTPLQHMAGMLDADVKLSGRFSDFKSRGVVHVTDARLEYQGVFRDVLQPKSLQLDYDMARDRKKIHVDVKHLAVDQFEAKGSFGMDDLDTDDPLLNASAVTKEFILREVRSYIPWGIIPEEVGDFIDVHIKDGRFRLVDGTLNGRISRIADFNAKESTDVLSIRAEVKQGIFEAHPTAPLFHDITGILELKKRQFSIRNIRARFGLSPLTMHGGISDFGLPYPVIYTAEMKIQPARGEIVWLLGKENFAALNFSGPSTLVLSGKGTDEDYHIDARWDLTNAAYSYPDVLEKPAARKNHLSADIVIGNDAVNVSSLEYELPFVKVKGSMMVRYNGNVPSSFTVNAKALDASQAAELLPVLRTYQPSGTGALTVAVRGDLSDPASIQLDGNISLNNISLKPTKDISPVRGLTGNVLFKGRSMETSLFEGQLGSSAVTGRFKIDDFRKPEFICEFGAKALQASDLGLHGSEGPVSFRDVKGEVAFKDKHIHINHLAFGMDESNFHLTGLVRHADAPKVSLEIASGYVSGNDVQRLASLRYPQKEKEDVPAMELNATMMADAGRLEGIDFQKLKAAVTTYAGGMLAVESLEADCFDGKFKAKGNVGINDGSPNTYDAAITIKGMSLEKLQSYLETGDRRITGRLSLTGNIVARGSNWEELKKTAEGTFQIRADKGVLIKYPVLSKIFSLLNVYQLLKFQLPDMAKDGMPYRTITADIAVKQGILSSNNFFIRSDAMEFSGNGRVNFIKKELDFITGVHPLQTIDVIASRIPIAGWILTDEKGKLITVHFKVGGTWDDPEVSPMPVKSIGKGTLDIFRRIFQLPEKLITDTGDVLFGR